MAKREETNVFLLRIQKDRQHTASSVIDFYFKKRRVRILSDTKVIKSSKKGGILYWMSREFRVQDNWTMLFAQKLALKNKCPLHVVFFLLPKFLDASIRHYNFLLKGLEEVVSECAELNISFHLYHGWPYVNLSNIVKANNIGAVVCDFFPLRLPMQWVDKVKMELQKDVPLVQVDGHNIVPCWITSDKKEYGARTIRPKINSNLDEFLTPFPPVVRHPYQGIIKIPKFDWQKSLLDCDIDLLVPEITWIQPGYKGGINMLESFCKKRLKNYATKRNDPCSNSLSNLSPWLHFGQISAQRCVLEVLRYKKDQAENVDAFCEEAITRRELSDNFCFYNPNYDNFLGIGIWGTDTLNAHRKDTRKYIYSRNEFENALTHDALWNSAQIELVTEGKIHGYMRMYWAKKILEWTETPEEAIFIAIYLNDRFSLDGCDPNGYAGIMWAICGVHDQSWAERPIFGKIRYMNFEGCKKKFRVDYYIGRWGGQEHPYVAKKQDS